MDPNNPSSPFRGRIIEHDRMRARDLIPVLIDGGFEILGAVHDDYISIGDAESSRVIYVSDHPGGRLELRRYERVTRTETPRADRELFAEALNGRVWGKIFIDADGDLVISHMICCLGGVYQPNFMQTVRAFLGLCRFIREDCDPAELLWTDGDPDGAAGDARDESQGRRSAGRSADGPRPGESDQNERTGGERNRDGEEQRGAEPNSPPDHPTDGDAPEREV